MCSICCDHEVRGVQYIEGLLALPFFFYLGLTDRQDYFTPFEPSHKTWLVSHVARARVEPTAVS